MKMNIRTKLVLCGALAVIAVVSTTVWIAYSIGRESLRRRIASHLVTVAQSRAAHVRTFLDSRKALLLMVARDPSIAGSLHDLSAAAGDRHAALDRLDAEIRNVAEGNAHIRELLILNNRGEVAASTSPASVGQDKSTDAYFLGAQTAAFAKDAHCSRAGGECLLTLSAPVVAQTSGEFLGVVVAEHHMADLNKILTDRTGFGKTGETYLINRYGFMITPSRFREDACLKLEVESANARQCSANSRAMRQGAELPGEHDLVAGVFPDYRGVPVLGAHAYIREMEWGLLAEIDAAEAFKPVAKLRSALLAAGALLIAAALLAAHPLSRHISRHIQQLHTGSERIAAGDFEHRLDIRTGDEIEQLAREFNRMADKMSESHATLEQAVVERTLELTATEERLRVTVDSIGDAVIAVDLERRVTLMNGEAARLTGHLAEEAIGRPLAEVFSIVHEETRQPAQDPVAQALREDRVIALADHTVLIGKDGAEHAVADSASPIRDEGGQVAGVVMVFRDVTQARANESKLAMFRQFAEAAGQGLGWADLEGHIRYVNPALCALFKRERPEDVCGKPVAQFYDEDTQRRLVEEIFPEVLAKGEWQGELEIHNANGDVVPTQNDLFAL